MVFRVVTTPSFDERLTSAVDYRMRTIGPASARHLLDKYDELLSILINRPLIGTTVGKKDSIPKAGELRWILMDSYVVIYHVSCDEEVVTLEDLFYKSSNWRRIVKSAFSAHHRFQ